MKLLIVTNNPYRASFRQRIGAYLDVLRTSGIDCEVARFPSGLLVRRKLFKQAVDFDGVFLHKKKLNFFDAHWLRRYSNKIIYNFDDAIMYSDKTPERDSRAHFGPWKRSVELADMVIVGSSYLAEHAQKFNSNVKILPIGLKVSDYRLDCPPENDDRIRLVWIGSKSTLPYLAQIRTALEEIGSRFDNVTLRIICDDFVDLKNIPVEKRLWSRDTRAIDLYTSDIGLAPLPDNRFTRGKCSFKVLEYASAGLPVIASPIGTNSDYVRNNVTGFFARNSKEWLDRITQLINNPQLRKKMGKEGQIYAEKFDMNTIGEKLAELIKECIEQPSLSEH
ncbi:MAG: glycosyltransferase family 4 protein [Planctomycetota bacterium]|jgi:glycosyltransferase involved in cell wall biosynthesis